MAGDPTPDGETYADVAARLFADPTALAEWLKEAPEGVAYDFARRLLAEAERDALQAAVERVRVLSNELEKVGSPLVADIARRFLAALDPADTTGETETP